ncbi:hypothetical protein D9V86_06795 [Bacteroidetes/Chlorobi group bacterium ChocPot_Mid]|nr:MAG: hypothetical protein D9V86_06795 [Bacteroidetes/Chlorobi group bacterium ChocPot_Mid]
MNSHQKYYSRNYIKKIIILISIITFSQFNLLAEYLTINANDLFSFPSSISYQDEKSKSPRTLINDYKSKPIILSQSFAETVFNTNKENIEINNFPISTNETANIHLVKSTPAVRKGTNWTIITDEGEKQLKFSEPAFYIGNIQNEPNSNVSVFYTEGNLYCIIQRDGFDNFSIAPLTVNSEKFAHILTSQGSSSPGKDFNPFLDVHLQNETVDYELIKKLSEKTLTTELLEADIIIEASYDFYKLFNNLDKVKAYIGAVMTHVSQIYESNVYIQLFVSQVVIQQNQATDPYRTTTQIYDRLYQLRDNWKKKSVKRSIVCLMTDIDYQGGSGGYRVGGVSLGLGTLCNNNQGYCVFGMQGHYTYPTTNYTWDVSVSAHELGHAFGSPHTHNCYFAPNMIDTCITRDLPQEGSDGCVTSGNPIPRLGTIMSYCHLTNSTHSVALKFHDRVKPIIRAFAEQASCLKKAVDPTLILLNPSGGSIFFPGDVVEIKWASAQVEYVAIKYSLDNGITWQWIEKYAEAPNGSYTWTIPDTLTNNLKILIQDSYNAYVSDETQTALTIDKPSFIFQTPKKNDRIGQDVKLKIRWEQKYLDNFIIEFNPNADKIASGESKWTTIASGITGFSYDWDVPDIESEKCLIRITGTMESGTKFTNISDTFAIGKPYFKLIYPQPYDVLCGGQNYNIKWESDFIGSMYVQYTTDNGENWRQVKFSPINGFDFTYNWKLPAIKSDNCTLRFSNYDNRNIVYAINNKPFIIDSCETDVEDNLNNFSQNHLIISSIVPNPSSGNITLSFINNDNSCKYFEISISNEKGITVEKYLLNNVKIGSNDFNMNLNRHSQGAYYITLQSCNAITGTTFKILK